jgi:hypothetical protein
MIAITVVAALVAYAWVSGYIGGTTSKVGNSIQIQSYAGDQSGNLVIYVQNVGQGTVQLNTPGAIYINDQLLQILLANGVAPGQSVTIPEGQTVALTVQPPGYYQGDYVKIKVVTSDGTPAQISGTGNSAQASAQPAGPAVRLVVSGFPNPANTGTPGSVTVTALDSNGLTATSYTGTVIITSSDAAANLPSNYAFVAGDNGVHTFSLTLNTLGTQSITATDTVTSSITGIQSGIVVGSIASPATHFAVSGFPASISVGVAGSVTVEALDASNNRATGYAGTVHVTSSDGSATLPANAGLLSGIGSFSVTLNTVGTQSITATDTVTSSITGVQNGISATATAHFDHFQFSAIGSQTVGVAFPITITAIDQNGATFSGFSGAGVLADTTGTIHPSGVTFTGGIASSMVTIDTALLSDVIHVSANSQGGDSSSFAVSLAPEVLDHFVFSTVGAQSVGVAFPITITAINQYGNTFTGYSDPGTLSDLTNTISPTSISFSVGVANPSVTVTAQRAADTITLSSGGKSVTSITFDVSNVLTASVSPTSWTMDIGQSNTFTATGSGGSGFFMSYQWYVDGAPQVGQTAQTFGYSPATAGTKSITATVTDSLGATSSQSSPSTINVAVSPTVTIAPAGPLTMNVDQTQQFTATPIGGSGTIHYNWLVDGSSAPSGSDSATYTYTAAGEGSHSVTCQVTDSANTPVTVPSNTVSVTVNVAYSVTFAAGNLGADATGTLLMVGTTTYTTLPQTLMVNPGTTYSFTTTVSAGTNKQYVLTGTSGLGSPINSAGTVTPTYKTQYQVTFAVSPSGAGSTTPSTATWYDAGVAGQAISATQNSGYTFSAWSADTGSITFGNVNSASTTATINGAGTITATFTQNQAQVTFVSAGTADASEGSGTNDPTPSYPTGLQAGDLILLQVTVFDTSTSPTTPTGFTLLYGDSNGADRQWIYYKFSTGSESGILTVSVSGSTMTMARMYAFRNVKASSFTEGGSLGTGTDSTVEGRTVATTGAGRLAVSFIFVDNNRDVSDFTGETGGNWAEVTNGEFQYNGNSDGTLDLQTATMAAAGTIQNGVATLSGSDNWGLRAFALIPR